MDEKKTAISADEPDKNINSSENKVESASKINLTDPIPESEDPALDECFIEEYKTEIRRSFTTHQAEEKATDDSNVQSQESPDSKQSTGNNSDWDDEITLEPQIYDDLNDENQSSDGEECEYDEPTDYDLGDSTDEKNDGFQISINFSGDDNVSPDEDIEEAPKKYDPEHPRVLDWIFDFAELLVFVLTAVILLTTFVFKHSVVYGESMNNTLSENDRVIISNLFYTPERYDIIVFEDYTTSHKKPLIKRVIGLPGETVEISLNSEGVYDIFINGNPLPTEEHAFYYAPFHPNLTVGTWELGEGEIFVMGDNRCNSSDSRDEHVGPISVESILGKALIRIYPFEKFGIIK